MSAYITLATPMLDQECLLLALADLGFDRDQVEVHEQAVVLVGFEGYTRGERAEIVIRKVHVGQASNDIGFERTPTGFRAHISDYDRTRYGAAWLERLHTQYQGHHEGKLARLAEAERQRLEEERRRLVEAQRQSIHDKARAMGYRVQESREGDRLRLVLVKRVY